MIGLLCFILAVLASPFKSKTRLEAENAALRHQLIVLRRKVKGRAHLTNNDRWFFILMYRWFPSILEVLVIIRPETLVHWHRAGFRRYWRWKFALSRRAAADRDGPARADPADERRKSSLGRATHSRRTPQARV
jgi:type II secretory pathway pseudopilin PulG